MGNTLAKRLNQARIDFANQCDSMSGKNAHLKYEYLQLKDIVPVAREVMTALDMMWTFEYDNGRAVVAIIDLKDDPEEPLLFSFGFTSDKEYPGMTKIQSYGCNLTYLRRYCLLCILDITEPDLLDNGYVETLRQNEEKKIPEKTAPTLVAPVKSEPTAPKITVTPENNGVATVEMKTELVNQLKKLKSLDAEQDDFVQEIVKKINEYTVEKCLVLIENIKKMISEYEVK